MDKLQGALVQRLEPQPVLKMMLAAKLATILELKEDEFTRLITEIEKEPVYQKLTQIKDTTGYPLLKFQRTPRTYLAKDFYEYKEEISYGEGSDFDVESLLQKKQRIVTLIRNIGIDKFQKYFLYNLAEFSLETVARECKLSLSEVKLVNSLVDEIAIHSEFYHPSQLTTVPGIRYFKIAQIEYVKETSELGVAFYSPQYVRGKYIVNYEAIETYRRQHMFTAEEWTNITSLLSRIELVNRRKNNINLILLSILEIQRNYLTSGNLIKLRPYSQVQLADDLGLSKSVLCRSIALKSVVTPWEEEVPLKDFFPTRKYVTKLWLTRYLANRDKQLPKLTDDMLRKCVQSDYGLRLSRRSINYYRREINYTQSYRSVNKSVNN